MGLPIIDGLFLAHPRSAGEGYFSHLRFAWRFGSRMLAGACAAFAHGLLPCVLTDAASRRVRELANVLESPRTFGDARRG
jgi:hypothetical protein